MHLVLVESDECVSGFKVVGTQNLWFERKHGRNHTSERDSGPLFTSLVAAE